MKNKGKPKDDLMAAIHETAAGLYKTGALTHKTMREFDELCLTPVKPLAPRKIRRIREHAKVSQSVFAYYLNVSTNSISQWERGEKHPSGAALKLLTLVDKKGLDAIM